MKKIWIALLGTVFILTGCAGNIKDGVKMLEAGKYQEAKELFQTDIEKGKNLAEAHRGMGIACFELKEYETALTAFESAIENGAKETPELYGFLGACYIETKAYDKALDIYTKALADKELTEELEQEIQFNLISVYEHMGNWDAAKKQMDNYIKAYPDDNRVDKEADFLETR